MSEARKSSPVIRKLATATCWIALLPIGMGALVTTLGAGMAFADWPSSDGRNMLLYPWFRDFRDHPDKFVEHGHRLAGMLIGLLSIVLCAATWKFGDRRDRLFGLAILLSVIAQGAIGGARVLLDRQVLAMVHSFSGAAFFTLCVVYRLICSDRYQGDRFSTVTRMSAAGAAVIFLSPVVVAGQYVLGGLLRHFHIVMNEHLAGAVVVAVVLSCSVLTLARSGHPLLRHAGLAVASILGLQVLLGIGAWVTRFGIQSLGFVATMGSPAQAVICSLHTVVGMTLLASTMVSAITVAALWKQGCLPGLRVDGAGLLPQEVLR